ncbi:hypothetical protein NC99_26300 [Sunxiuqinia dokdonensis]|uniref:Uncharacterized protein n=1 Tax=Sunxiuqinia dokdonensis TaxID=1409788 RepID=A0A0L8V7X9_9BACT|nr:hypothetical protein NC99_26300 [Sunxiuqinia dokdonensis]
MLNSGIRRRLVTPLLVAAYLFLGTACSHSHDSEEHNHDHDDELAQEHIHSEGDDHEHDHDHENEPHAHEHDETYGVIEIRPKDFQEVIHTSGKIMPAQGDEITLTATHDGAVVFGSKALFPGETVRAGEKLVTISGKGLIHDNIETTFMDAKSAYETAKANYERAELLNEDKITSDKELAEIKMLFEKAKNNYDAIRQNYSAGGQNVTASTNGYIKEILVSEGQFVNTGQPLLKLTKNKRLVVQADVPLGYGRPHVETTGNCLHRFIVCLVVCGLDSDSGVEQFFADQRKTPAKASPWKPGRTFFAPSLHPNPGDCLAPPKSSGWRFGWLIFDIAGAHLRVWTQFFTAF